MNNPHIQAKDLRGILKPKRELPVRSSELVMPHEPRFSEMELTQSVNEECTCGGGGPEEKHTCPACKVYHRLMRHNTELRRGGDKAKL